uniref:Uncharacterized protein n=1 Tax=Rhizophora mucronata TaxID=61149 RepID=A0A2P2Q0I0_RHIMU
MRSCVGVLGSTTVSVLVHIDVEHCNERKRNYETVIFACHVCRALRKL